MLALSPLHMQIMDYTHVHVRKWIFFTEITENVVQLAIFFYPIIVKQFQNKH